MRPITALATLALCLPASASNIYIVSSGDPTTDGAVVAALTSHGHTCTLGVSHAAFDGSQSLSGFQTVYLQDNYDWGVGPMPTSGQQALTAWVMAGGRLVTSEWMTYYSSSFFSNLGPIMPLATSFSYGGLYSTTYDRATPDATIDAGVPSTLTFALTTYSGTEVYTTAKAGATVYFTSRGAPNAVGLAGWAQGTGSVFSFSTTCGPDQLGDANFARLFANVMGATATSSCYANCDGSTTSPVLNVLDFSCFLNRFAAGSTYANCDGSTTPPVLNVLDFSCFLNRFAAGCP